MGIALGLYANSLGGDFIWDDEFLIQKNRFLEGWHQLPEIFRSPLHLFSPIPSPYYRPLVTISFLMDRTLWGGAAWGFHWTNVLLHGTAGFLVFRLALALGLGGGISFWVGLFFLVHPLHTEAVSYLSGRADPLVACWLFLGSLSFLRFLTRLSWISYGASLGFFALALLSKEIAVLFPLFLALLLWYRGSREVRYLFPFAALLVLYGLFRLTLQGFPPFPEGDAAFLQRGKVSIQSLLLYLKLILFPFPLYMERRLPYDGPFWRGETIMGGVAAILFFILCLRSGRKRTILFGWGWFAVTVFPTLGLFLRTNRVAEHFLYLALFGMAVAVVPAVREVFGRSALWVGVFFVFCFSVLTYQQNRIWETPERFYRHLLAHNPESVVGLNNLGTLLLEKGKYEEAVRMFEEGLRQAPNHPRLRHNLANAYRMAGNWEKAVSLFQEALKWNPDSVESRYFLGKTYEAMGRRSLAEEQYRMLEERGIRVKERP